MVAGAAALLLSAGIVDLLRPADPTPAVDAPAAARSAAAVELHRLLPDASDDVGKTARLDGTVARVDGRGLWVRDFRDYLVYVIVADGLEALPSVGAAVTVVGILERLVPAPAWTGTPARSGLIVRDVALRARSAELQLLDP